MSDPVFDSQSNGVTFYAGSVSCTHVVGAGANRYLVAFCQIPSTTDKVSSVTYGGVAMTRVSRIVLPSACTNYVYVLANPASGSASLVWNFATADNEAHVINTSWSNVNQSTPTGTIAGSSDSYNSPITTSVTTGSGNVAVSFISGSVDGAFTANGGETVIINSDLRAAASYKSAATAMSWSWSTGNRAVAHTVVPLNGVSAADTTPPVLSSPTGTKTGTSTATGTVTTDEVGTLYRLASTNATETAATIIAANLTSTVTATGVQNVTFTGLAPGGTYYPHYVEKDNATPTPNTSNVVNGASFTTDATNTVPTFSGTIANITGTGGAAITPADVHALFTDTDALTYSASPAGTAWPSGLVVNATTGIISGTVATSTTAGLKVRATDTAAQTVDSNAFSVTISAPASTVSGVTVSPATATVAALGTQAFTASVAGTGGPSQTVNWTSTAGSITSGGAFTAPAATGSDQTVTVKATSAQDGVTFGTATVTVPAATVGTLTSRPLVNNSTTGGVTSASIQANQTGWALYAYSLTTGLIVGSAKTGLTTNGSGLLPAQTDPAWTAGTTLACRYWNATTGAFGLQHLTVT